ncbi:hypothetical protein FG05_35030 [Fusarium graminearum]|nr:hypothetical protein FG05_35030 [Fusarium graminearum]
MACPKGVYYIPSSWMTPFTASEVAGIWRPIPSAVTGSQTCIRGSVKDINNNNNIIIGS